MPANTGPLDLSQYITGVTDRAYKNWAISDDQLAEAKKAYARAQGVADKVSEGALDASGRFRGYAQEDQERYRDEYVPAEREQLAFARGYTTPERMMSNRAAAGATVGRAATAGMDAAMRDLQSHNIDPSSGAYVGLKEGLALQKAAAQAGAMTKSDRDTEMLGQQYLANAIGTGAKLPGQAVNEEGLAMTEGNTAVNTQLAPANAYFSWSGTAPEWSKLGSQSYQEWRNAAVNETEAGQRANELQARTESEKSKQSSGAGALIGAGAGLLGTFLGGPMGGMVGSSLGKMAGSGWTFAEGGVVPEEAAEGDFDWEDEEGLTPEVGTENMMVPPEASPSGGAMTDDVTAQVNVGEFVVPKDVTGWLGEKFFQKLIEKSRAEMAGPQEAEPEVMETPPEAMALSPTFRSEGAMQGA